MVAEYFLTNGRPALRDRTPIRMPALRIPETLKRTWLLAGLVGLAVLAWLVVAWVQSDKPDPPETPQGEGLPTGHRTVESTVRLMEAQLNSAGGWLPNDLPVSPSYLLDNVPAFQIGVLDVVRHTARVLRDHLTRQRTSDEVHPKADAAYSAYANEPRRWAFPSAESAFQRGNRALRAFNAQLGETKSFFPRADNLVQLLEMYVSELGAVTTLLLNARRPGEVAWCDIDDNFYRAQGVGYGVLTMMRTVRQDFQPVLEDKNALEITDLIIGSLADSQFEPWMVTNGSRDGILANHSSNLKAYLDDARQKMNSLITMLREG